MSWIYKNRVLTRLPKDAYGFVYIIQHTPSAKFYIGKKSLEFSRKKRLTLKEKKLIENKRKRFKIETKQSDWKDYWSSSLSLKEDIEKYDKKNFRRKILKFYTDKINLTYGEMEWQFKLDVLRKDTWNMSIGGKFFRGKIK